jgi:drug/metabolite transporter (DMT)-like permease
VCYTFAGRKINAITAIAISLPLSWLALIVLHRLTLGEFFPIAASSERWLLLGISGILAFVISQFFMLNAYQHIGPRLTMLIASFAPVVGALLDWVFWGRSLPLPAIVGIGVVIFGVVWVVAERGKARAGSPEPDRRRGVLFAALGTLAQGASFVFAAQGIMGGFPPFSAALLRITASIIALWAFIALQRQIKSTVMIARYDRRLLLQLAGAAVSGPVIAGALLLLSFQFIPVGVATTLSHTTAIMLIPVGYLVFKERPAYSG